jgi:demethylmenaquinone methyltransferase/2-methoxy-6-polyprenyl-1,4-benzoquinol methylase
LSFDGNIIARKFFSSENASSYDFVVRYTTFGKDSTWKKHIVEHIKEYDKCILDLACGTGICSTFIKSDNLNIYGVDMTYDYILKAKNRRKYSFLTNSVAEFLPFKSDIFDVVISSYLVKYTNIQLLVDEVWRITKKNGSVIFHDFIFPDNIFVKILWQLYFKILNLIGKITRSWQTVFSNLDKVIKEVKWTKELLDALSNKGFKSITIKSYTLGTSAIVLAIKP